MSVALKLLPAWVCSMQVAVVNSATLTLKLNNSFV